MAEDDIGKEMNFLDINKALRDGNFGPNPRVWGDKEWNLLIDYVSGGIEFADEDWNTIADQPPVWSTIHKDRTSASPARKAHILQLKTRAESKDEYLRHLCNMPRFKAGDARRRATPTITESTAEGDDDDKPVGSFGNFESVW